MKSFLRKNLTKLIHSLILTLADNGLITHTGYFISENGSYCFIGSCCDNHILEYGQKILWHVNEEKNKKDN